MFQFSTATRREPYSEGKKRERPEGDQGLGSFSRRIFDVVSQFGKNDNAQRRGSLQKQCKKLFLPRIYYRVPPR